DDSFPGYLTEQEFFNNPNQGRGTYQTVIEDGSTDGSKVITSTARVYRHGDSGELVSSRGVKVTVVGTTSEGYSVHTGPGGLILTGSASITNSDVYVNGTLSLSGASSIGTHAKPSEVKVAHQACPT